MLSRKIRSVLDEYTTFKFKHCEFNHQQGRLIFLFKRTIYFYFFLIFFTFVLEHSFMFNNIYSRLIFVVGTGICAADELVVDVFAL